MIIGICGKSGSGKSTLSNEIINNYKNKVVHVDIDKIGHSVYSNHFVLEELLKCFGPSVFKNNNVDRKKLGELVFNSREEMAKLTNITWKYMELKIDKILKDNQDKIIILDWILLPQTKYFNKCDISVLLDIPYQVRKKRAMKRDNITSDAFDLREKASIEYDKEKFDIILKDNLKDIDKLVKIL